MRAKGACLCGAVLITVDKEFSHFDACHCSTCRKWGGGPLLAINCGSAVSFCDEAAVSRYDSSDWAERGFCMRCGTHLFYRLKQNNLFIMPLGLFDNLPELEFKSQIFIDEKPGCYHFAENTQNLAGAEFFALFQSK